VAAPCIASAQQGAQQQQPNENDRVARAEFTAGRDAFAHGDFEQAARRFEHAFQLSQRRELLYNIGTAYERLHRWEPARDAFTRYLAAFPNAPERDEVRGRLTAIDAEIQRERERASASPPPRETVTVVHERVVVREVPTETHPVRTAGIVIGGLGVLSGIAALTIGLVTNAFYDDLANGCGQTAEGCPEPVIQDVQLRATLVNVFLAGAGALVITGATLVIVDYVRSRNHPAEQRPRTARIGFAIAPNGNGASAFVVGTW
jgi:hypothetical protein